MKKKLPIAIRGILSTAILLLVAALLNTTPVQSAFPNAPTAGTLTVVKTLINDNGGSLSNINFSFSVNGGASIPFEADGQNDLAVDNGEYDIVEDATAGYTTTYNNCTAVTIADNTQTCTITNNDQPATLIVKKVVTNDNGGTLNAENFTFSVNGGAAVPFDSDGQNDLLLNAGSYSVVEPPVAGYTTTYDNCTGLNIPIGGTETCTITNNDISPELTIIKNVVNDNGGILGSGDFTINVTGTNVSSSSFPGAVSPGTTVTLDAGSYSVAETPVTGYEASYSADCTETIAVGETKTCTITNEDFARLTVVKDPTNDNGGTALPDEFLLTVNGSPVLSGIATEYPIDTPLAINETQLVGYTFVGITDDGSGKCPAVLGGTITLALGDDITCTIVNDDIPGIKAVPSSGLVTDENGTTDQFTVELTTIPTGIVTIAVSSSLPTEATAAPVLLNFTGANWNTPQQVTVTGVDDQVADGDTPFNIILNPAASPAAEYAALPPVQVSGTNFDNDIPGYIINPVDNFITTEGGGSQKVEISLRTKPTALVSLSAVSSDLTEGTVSFKDADATIDPAIWPQPAKEVIITGVDDILVDGNIVYSVTISASSSDSNYSGTVSVLPVTNHDAPTIKWVKPVEPVTGDESTRIYYAKTPDPILLEVESVGLEPIIKVRFYRWVESIGDGVIIGDDLTEPYQELLDPADLTFGWNEIRAFAFSPVPTLPGEIQTYSTYPYIFIYKEIGDYQINLPLLSK
jgi:hypothetical protein